MTPRAQRLQTLTARLADSITFQRVVTAVLEDGLPVLRSQAGTVTLLEGDHLVLAGATGFDDALTAPWQRFPLTAPVPLAEAVRTRRGVWVESPDALRDRYGREPLTEVLTVSQAWAALPLIVGESILGALGVSYPQPRSFDEADQRYGETLAHLCAQALERSRLHSERERQARFFDAMLATLQDYVYSLDREGRFVYANPALLELWGRTAADALGKTMTELAYPETIRVVLLEGVREVFATARVVRSETQYTAPDGRTGFFENVLAPVLDEHGAVTLITGSSREVTERKRTEATLRASESRLQALVAAQRRFVADAAHELRAPLTSIRGNLELLLRHPDVSAQDRLEMTRDAERESGRLARLVTDLLTLARGDASEEREFVPLRLAELVASSVRIATHLVPDRSVELGPVPSVQVLGDRDALTQLLLALLDNALTYSAASTAVRIDAAVEVDGVCVHVSDVGEGIAAADLERVFERFYRVDRARTPGVRPGGTGLGLSIARQIAERHGGQLWLESALGMGTTAVLRLPLMGSEERLPPG